jgi:protein TonB
MHNAHAHQFDAAITALLSGEGLSCPEDVDRELSEMLAIASDLRRLPTREFKKSLKAQLAGETNRFGRQILPTLFGLGYGTYPPQRTNFAMSLVAHAMAVLFVVYSSAFVVNNRVQIKRAVTDLMSEHELSVYVPSSTGGGGGGNFDRSPATKGSLPLRSQQQITPPVEIRNDDPKLAVQPTIALDPAVRLPNVDLRNLGDPTAHVGIASLGTGTGGGIGEGRGTGLGLGTGGNTGGGVFRVGGGVTAPIPTYRVEPEFTPEARQAKFQGTVLVSLVVGADGRTRDIRVLRPVGMGLDQNAMEAVKQWRFEPAKKDGKPVPVYATIEVEFRLF